MTIEEAKEVIEQDIPCEHDVDLIDALNMAIASLDAWQKVKQEIEDLEKSYGFDKATKYGNKDGKQMDLSYSTMFMYEIAGMVDEIKEIIDKHLQEVTE